MINLINQQSLMIDQNTIVCHNIAVFIRDISQLKQ